jgi:hypothetical protein
MATVAPGPIVIQQPTSQSKTIEVLRILAWPLFALIIVSLFWLPLHKLISSVPEVLANSETVTVGSLSLHVGKSLSDRVNQDVRDALSGMTSDDVKTVMENDVGSEPTLYQGGNYGDYAKEWGRLGRLGVVHVLTDTELKTEQKKGKEKEPYVYGVTATAKYDRLRNFLYGVLNEIVTGGVRTASADKSNAMK